MTSGQRETVDVLIVDDHDIVRLGIRALLEQSAGRGFQVAEADSGEQALEMVQQSIDPGVILMDVHMPGIGGLEATRRLLAHHPEARIIILTAIADGPMPRALLRAGASGYITKGCSVDEMLRAIRQVRAGQRYVGTEVAQHLALSMLEDGQTSPLDQLSERELQLVLLVSQGLRNPDIARTMCISPKTVSTYRSRVMQKLGINSDAELTRLALEHGLAERI